jgi:hypothetical protein
MSQEIIVWDNVCWLDRVFSEFNEGLVWFDNNKLIVELNHCPDTIKNSNKKKVVIVEMWIKIAQKQYDMKMDLSWADLVIIQSSEILDDPTVNESINNAILFFNNKNCIFVYNGKSKLQSEDDRVFTKLQTFFSKVVYASEWQDIKNNEAKPYLFDCLLGLNKPHRQFVFDKIYNNKELLSKTLLCAYNVDQNLVTYLNGAHWKTTYESPDLLKYDNAEFRNAKDKGITSVTNNNFNLTYKNTGFTVWNSCITPWEIYKHSWYTIVTETQHQHVDFISEKTAKPIYAKRLFVVFAADGHLALLKKWGYKTFDCVIDESYDSEPNKDKRMAMAYDQIEKLATLDPIVVYQKIHEILEFNYNLIINRRGHFKEVKEFIQGHINKL